MVPFSTGMIHLGGGFNMKPRKDMSKQGNQFKLRGGFQLQASPFADLLTPRFDSLSKKTPQNFRGLF